MSGAMPVTDNAASLTIDAPVTTPVFVRLSDGTTAIATLPVSGPLTDTQLRASAVPVSGPVTDTQLRASAVPVSGPLTDTQLRASAVPVSGGLTDTQLRASAVPVSMATQSPDVTDRATRETGRIRVWDGTDEATVVAARAGIASTDKALAVMKLPVRSPNYGITYARVTPTVSSTGAKELFHFFHANTVAADVLIQSVDVAMLVTTASTAGNADLECQMITAIGSAGTSATPQPLDPSLGASGCTATAAPTSAGTGTGQVWYREAATYATTPVGITRFPILGVSDADDGIILRGGTAFGFKVYLNVAVLHSSIVAIFTCRVRWIEI